MILYSLLTATVDPIPMAGAEQFQWRLRWQENWPLWATALAAMAAIAWVMACYFHENSPASRATRILLGSLRLTALALVLMMSAMPALESVRLERPRLLVLIDRSASMGTLDQTGVATRSALPPATRLETVKALLTDGERSLIEQWRATYQLDVVAFDEDVELLPHSSLKLASQVRAIALADEASRGTRIGDAIDYGLRKLAGPPPAAIIVLTDGIETDRQTLPRAAERARRLTVPLYTVAVGSEQPRPDIGVENLLVEERVFRGDRLQLEATVRARGYVGQQAVVVARDGVTQEVLARADIELPSDESTKTVRLTIGPSDPGQLSIELVIEPRDDEVNLENNVARQIVEVRDEKIRVLLVQAQPSYEYRAIKSLLQRDPAVELHTYLQEADADYFTVDDTALRSFPAQEQALFAYDVLLLGDVDPRLLPRSVWPWIERFVSEHGGGMVGIAGPRYMPMMYGANDSLQVLLPIQLDSLVPLRWQKGDVAPFTVVPTSLGWRTPSFQLGETTAQSRQIWSKLPPLYWMLRAEHVKPGAQALAECRGLTNGRDQQLPVVLRHYVGAGEVWFHTTDESWRWRWRSDDRYFARYWGQVVRRLGRGRLAAGRQGVQLAADRSLYQPGESVQLLARFRNPLQAPTGDDQVIVQLQDSLRPPRQITLLRRIGRRGLFAAKVEGLTPGEYEMLLVSPSLAAPAEAARFEIQQPTRELAQVVVNRQGLLQAAEVSGGKSYTVATAQQLSEELPPLRQQTLAALPPRPIWNSHAVMALFVMVVTCEWILRRRFRML